MFVYLFTFILTVWHIFCCKTIIFEAKHQLYTNSQSQKQVVGISAGIEYTMVGFLSGRYVKLLQSCVR